MQRIPSPKTTPKWLNLTILLNSWQISKFTKDLKDPGPGIRQKSFAKGTCTLMNHCSNSVQLIKR